MKGELTILKSFKTRNTRAFVNIVIVVFVIALLTAGILMGIRSIQQSKNEFDVASAFLHTFKYGKELNGNFIITVIRIFYHNLLLNILYGVSAFFTIGLSSVLSVIYSAYIYGSVFESNHSFLATLFILCEVYVTFLSTYIALKVVIGTLVYKEKIPFKLISITIFKMALVLLVGAIIETIFIMTRGLS